LSIQVTEDALFVAYSIK